MNTVQNLLMIVVKLRYFDLFKTFISPEEKICMDKIRMSPYFKTLKLGENIDGKNILIWKSCIGKPVECIVTDTTICFTDVGLHNDVGYLVETNFLLTTKRVEILENEIEDLKKIFISYDKDAETYFT